MMYDTYMLAFQGRLKLVLTNNEYTDANVREYMLVIIHTCLYSCREKHVLWYVHTVRTLYDQNTARLKLILKNAICSRCLLGTLQYARGMLVVH